MQLETLLDKVERLCARCRRLHREQVQLKSENKRLRERNAEAKRLLQNLKNQLDEPNR